MKISDLSTDKLVMYRRGIIQAFPERHWDVGFDWNRYENFMNAVDAELKKRGYDLENCCFNNAEENDAIEQSIRKYQDERLRQYGHNIKENKKTRMKKQTIRLNEADFHRLVKETVRRVLKEDNEESNKKFDKVYDYVLGFAPVKLNGKWNFIDKEGNLLSNIWFDEVMQFQNSGYAPVFLDGMSLVIDKTGKLYYESAWGKLIKSKLSPKYSLVKEQVKRVLKESVFNQDDFIEWALNEYPFAMDNYIKYKDKYDIETMCRNFCEEHNIEFTKETLRMAMVAVLRYGYLNSKEYEKHKKFYSLPKIYHKLKHPRWATPG